MPMLERMLAGNSRKNRPMDMHTAVRRSPMRNRRVAVPRPCGPVLELNTVKHKKAIAARAICWVGVYS